MSTAANQGISAENSIHVDEDALRRMIGKLKNVAERMTDARSKFNPEQIDENKLMGKGKDSLYNLFERIYLRSDIIIGKCNNASEQIDLIIRKYQSADSSLERSLSGGSAKEK